MNIIDDMRVPHSTKPTRSVIEIDERNLIYHKRLEHFLNETKSPRVRTLKGLLVGSIGKGGPPQVRSSD